MGTHNVKILTKKQTKRLRVYMCMGNKTVSTYAYGGQCEWLKDMYFYPEFAQYIATE